jgi:DNA end-binding protein Ku
MPRAVWTGAISFGLVNVGVKAFTAVRDHKVHFHQIDRKSGKRVHNQKIAGSSGRKLEKDDITMGYEVSDGRYVTVDPDEIAALRPRTTKTIDIGSFVELAAIDPVYYHRTYWLAPDGAGAAKSYQLLRAVMEEQGRVGIGTVVMRNTQYLAAIRPYDRALAMSTMRFADEVVPLADIDELPARRSSPDAKQKKLAQQILDSLADEWNPDRYRDTYTDTLTDLIRKRAEGEQVEVEEEPQQEAAVLDLMAALQESVDAAKASRGHSKAKRRTTRRKSA